MKYTIYTLSESLDSDHIYIGITRNSLSERLSYHVKDARSKSSKSSKSPKARWLRGLLIRGARAVIRKLDVIDTDDPSEAGHREQLWIDHFTRHNYDMLNVRRGGGGIGRSRSNKTRYDRQMYIPSRWAIDNMGVIYDYKIAEREGVSSITVSKYRKYLNIPASHRKHVSDRMIAKSLPVIDKHASLSEVESAIGIIDRTKARYSHLVGLRYYQGWVRSLKDSVVCIADDNPDRDVIVNMLSDLTEKLTKECDESFPSTETSDDQAAVK